MYRSSRQKIKKETQTVNDILNQVDLIDIYRAFHPKAAEYIFFSSAHGTFPRIGTCWATKQSVGKFKEIKIVSSIFFDNVVRLEINYGKKLKNTNTWQLNDMILSIQWIIEEIKE